MLLQILSDWFWSPSIWLIPGKTWDDMKSTESYTIPETRDIYTSLVYMTIVFLCIRFVLTRFLFKPVAKLYGMPDAKQQMPPKNAFLEEVFYTIGKTPSKITVKEISTKLKWTDRQVERWLRARASVNKTSKLFKFCDSCWQLTYYVFYTCFGIFVMWDKEWLWDIRHCWYGYPYQNLTNDIWWYYMIPLGFYTSSILTFFVQPKRKDHLVLFLHHIVTIILIFLSWSVNLVRIGSLVLIVHECADIPLQMTKLMMYLKNDRFANLFFLVFMMLWIFSRLGLFPFWVVRSSLFQAHVILDTMCFMYYIFNGLLIILIAFHVFWTYFIIRILVRKVRRKKSIQDSRSDSDSSESDFEESEEDKKDL